MNITIIGCGYVGLVSGTCLSDIGHNVVCLDINKNKINNLNKGIMPIYEDGLEKMIAFNSKKKRLSFTSSYRKAISHSDIIFLCVDTPSNKNGTADLTSIKNTCISISKYMTSNKIIIEKSSVPVGTSDLIRKIISKNLLNNNKELNFDVVSNPEFLKEGSAIIDFMKPDRIIIGMDNVNLKPIFDEIYLPFNRKFDKIQYMDIKSAELTKYAANAMLATKISFINEIANIADKLGVDIENVRKGIGADKRIGTEFLYPGCGYGGSCFPKDIKALISTSKDKKYNAKLLKSVDEVNDAQKDILSRKISSHFKNKLSGKTFGVWGLAFKPNTDDVRYAPSINLVNYLIANNANVQAYDPIASIKTNLKTKSINYKEVSTAIKALKNIDGLIVCTEWKEFWSVDLTIFLKHMTNPVIFDGRNIFSPDNMEKHGIVYYGIGRGNKTSL
jgi:UDPglucose 6-dehydrogenase